jgi:hypothetical protein
MRISNLTMKSHFQGLKRWIWRVVLWASVLLFLTTGISWFRAAFFAADSDEFRFFENTHIRALRIQTARGGIYFEYGHYRYFKKGEKEGEYIPLTHEEFIQSFEDLIRKGWWEHKSSPFLDTYYESYIRRALSPSDSVQNEGVQFNGMGMAFDWYEVWGTRSDFHRIDALAFQAVNLATPFWILMVLFGVIPLYALGRLSLRIIRKHRLKPGHCIECGYDLRAHAAGQKCPECGKVIEAGDSGVSTD